MSLFDGYKIHQEIRSVLKIYPKVIKLIKYREPLYLRRYDYDENRPWAEKKKKIVLDEDDYIQRSVRRAKTTINDIALCNNFELFVTLTTKKDRYNDDAKKQQIAFWLHNQRNQYGKFGYILLPERHKDGALHFHGLFSDYKGKLNDSGKRDKEKIIFNLGSYRGGWTTAKQIDQSIDDVEKVANYITKYITKNMPVFKNKRRFWCSTGLKRPLKIVNPLLNEGEKELFTEIFSNNQKQILEYKGQLPDKSIARIADYGKRREDDLVVSEW